MFFILLYEWCRSFFCLILLTNMCNKKYFTFQPKSFFSSLFKIGNAVKSLFFICFLFVSPWILSLYITYVQSVVTDCQHPFMCFFTIFYDKVSSHLNTICMYICTCNMQSFWNTFRFSFVALFLLVDYIIVVLKDDEI